MTCLSPYVRVRKEVSGVSETKNITELNIMTILTLCCNLYQFRYINFVNIYKINGTKIKIKPNIYVFKTVTKWTYKENFRVVRKDAPRNI